MYYKYNSAKPPAHTFARFSRYRYNSFDLQTSRGTLTQAKHSSGTTAYAAQLRHSGQR